MKPRKLNVNRSPNFGRFRTGKFTIGNIRAGVADSVYSSARSERVLLAIGSPLIARDASGHVIGSDPSAASPSDFVAAGIDPPHPDLSVRGAALEYAIHQHCISCGARRRALPNEDGSAISKVMSCQFSACPLFARRCAGVGAPVAKAGSGTLAAELAAGSAALGIARYCSECRGGDPLAVYLCHRTLCPLWPYRPYDASAVAAFEAHVAATPPHLRHPPPGRRQSPLTPFLLATAPFLAGDTEAVSSITADRALINAPDVAVARNCIACRGGAVRMIVTCPSTACSLWHFRPADLAAVKSAARKADDLPAVNARARPRGVATAIARYCMDCRGGVKANVLSCQVSTCSLWRHRQVVSAASAVRHRRTSTKSNVDPRIAGFANLTLAEREIRALEILRGIAAGDQMPSIFMRAKSGAAAHRTVVADGRTFAASLRTAANAVLASPHAPDDLAHAARAVTSGAIGASLRIISR